MSLMKSIQPMVVAVVNLECVVSWNLWTRFSASGGSHVHCPEERQTTARLVDIIYLENKKITGLVLFKAYSIP